MLLHPESNNRWMFQPSRIEREIPSDVCAFRMHVQTKNACGVVVAMSCRLIAKKREENLMKETKGRQKKHEKERREIV